MNSFVGKLKKITLEQSGISVNKYISESGFCSRREADKYVEMGRVTINNKVVRKGNRVEVGQIVKVDGEIIKKKKNTDVYIVLNKPKGVTCTTDLKDKSNIIDFINYKSRIFPIGRLDKLSDGLIFLTNDGDIVNTSLPLTNLSARILLKKWVTECQYWEQLQNNVT